MTNGSNEETSKFEYDVEGKHLGVIRSGPDPPGVTVDRWLIVAGNDLNLVPNSPVKGIDPCTNRPMVNSDARIMIDGEQVGLSRTAINNAARGVQNIDWWLVLKQPGKIKSSVQYPQQALDEPRPVV